MNTSEIRQYNKEVQAYQKKASELLASKDYQQKELIKLCKELSDLTGQQVTPDNLETVYQSLMSQFQQTLKTGREIIERAKAEEQSLNVSGATMENTQNSMNQQSQGIQGGQGGQFGMNQQNLQNQQASGLPPFGNNMNTGFAPFGQNNGNGMGMPSFGNGMSNSPFNQQYDAHGKVGQI